MAAVITVITLGPSEGNRILKKKVLGRAGLGHGSWLSWNRGHGGMAQVIP